MDLPREIADLCGIIDSVEYVPGLGQPSLPSPLQTVKDHNNVWTVIYNNNEIGWINKIGLKVRDEYKYRAVAANGSVKHCPNFNLARSFIVGEYY
ncbi:MAG: hypothetical protein AMJ65_14535 [Phycisphaerae bacterium SG8_4]|nr:MAG: hypothetical protein AMJ65_14535 [Phycisphaerae bacterium SG8_4]